MKILSEEKLNLSRKIDLLTVLEVPKSGILPRKPEHGGDLSLEGQMIGVDDTTNFRTVCIDERAEHHLEHSVLEQNDSDIVSLSLSGGALGFFTAGALCAGYTPSQVMELFGTEDKATNPQINLDIHTDLANINNTDIMGGCGRHSVMKAIPNLYIQLLDINGSQSEEYNYAPTCEWIADMYEKKEIGRSVLVDKGHHPNSVMAVLLDEEAVLDPDDTGQIFNIDLGVIYRRLVKVGNDKFAYNMTLTLLVDFLATGFILTKGGAFDRLITQSGNPGVAVISEPDSPNAEMYKSMMTDALNYLKAQKELLVESTVTYHAQSDH